MKEIFEEKLDDYMNVFSTPALTSQRKLLIKEKLFSEINRRSLFVDADRISSHVRDFSSFIHIPLFKKVLIKERIFSLIDSVVQKRFSWTKFFAFQKKIIAAVGVFVMVFSIFSFMNIDTKLVWAQGLTTLSSFSGEVLIERDGKFLRPEFGMKIYEKDGIKTSASGFAVVRFFDDSVSRLSANTEIVVSKLFKPENSSSKSYVEVSLLGGNLWSRVVNVVNPDSSFVVQAMNVYLSAKKAAFNVRLNGSKLNVGVFNDSVEVSENGHVKKVSSGEKAVKILPESSVKIASIGKDENGDSWVKNNLQSDQEYLIQVEKKLLSAKIESVGSFVQGDISLENSLKDKTILFLTFDDVKKKKLELDLAEKNFVTAQIKLSDPNSGQIEKDNANNTVNDFYNQTKDFYDFAKKVGTTDQKYAEELKRYADEKVLMQKKMLSLVAPDSSLSHAKKIVDDLGEFVPAEERNSVIVEQDKPVESDKSSDKPVGDISNSVSVPPVDVQKEEDENYGVGMRGDKVLPPMLR